MLTQNPAYSGSYHRIEEVPDLSAEGAFKLIQNRLRAFESGSEIPVFIDKAGVDFAFKQVADRHAGHVTCRDFIDYILPNLEKGEFENAGISVAIDREGFEKIHNKLQESAMAESYALFRQLTLHKGRTRRSCRIALERIYKGELIGEIGEFFQLNRGALWVLQKSNMIQKVHSSRSQFAWGMSKDLIAVLETLNEQGMRPEVIFRCLSMDPERLPIVDPARVDTTLSVAQDLLAQWGSEWPETVVHLEGFIRQHSTVSELFNRSGEELVAACQGAIRDLISAIQTVMQTHEPSEKWVQTTWLELSAPEVIISVLGSPPPTRRETFDFVSRYQQSVRVLADLLDEVFKSMRIGSLVNSKLGKDDLRGLFAAAVSIEDGDLDRAIDELNTRLEEKIRSTFHMAFSLHYGPNYAAELPKSIRDRIPTGPTVGAWVLKRKADSNLFYHASRGEYAQVVNEGDHWERIFKAIFTGQNKADVVNQVHRCFTLDTRRAHRDKPEYFREVRRELVEAISYGKRLLESMDSTYRLALNPPGFVTSLQHNEVSIKISFLDQDHCSSSSSWILSEGQVSEITQRIQHHSSAVVLSSDSAVAAALGYSTPHVCLVAAAMVRKGLLEVVVEGGPDRVRFRATLKAGGLASNCEKSSA